MLSAAGDARVGGIVFAKLFPNPAEPFRGKFVADQVLATRDAVEWSVIAPVPWVPRLAATAFGKPYVHGDESFEGIVVRHPRHLMLPKRMLYATVADAMAAASEPGFRDAVREVNARFVHGHELYPGGAAARRLARKAGLPYVVTTHGLDVYLNLDNPAWRAEITATVRDAAAVIAVAPKLAADVVELLGANPGKTLIIPNTYEVDLFRFAERPAHSGPVRLVSVGRLSSEKGHDVLLRALSTLTAEGGDLALTIVGDGPERSRLTELAVALGVAERVRFTGVLTGRELAAELAAADLSVLPSRSEGFGVAVIEAMATGLPVVATRSGGPETIIDAETGVLVATDDPAALAAGLADAVARLASFDRAAIAARATARYAPAAVGERLVRLYREVLGGGPLTGTIAGAS